MSRTLSIKELDTFIKRQDDLLDALIAAQEENRDLRVENAVLRSLLPEDARALLVD